MEEKPVRRSNWMAVASLCLGILGFMTSLLLYILFENWLIPGFDPFSFLPDWYVTLINSIWFSSLAGLTGLILGIISYRRTTVSRRIARAGIILCILAILGGLPSLILFYVLMIILGGQ